MADEVAERGRGVEDEGKVFASVFRSPLSSHGFCSLSDSLSHQRQGLHQTKGV